MTVNDFNYLFFITSTVIISMLIRVIFTNSVAWARRAGRVGGGAQVAPPPAPCDGGEHGRRRAETKPADDDVRPNAPCQ